MTINVVSDIKCMLGEGPFWEDRTYSIYWVDIPGCEFHIYEFRSGKQKAYKIGQMIGCIVPGKDPDIIFAALENGFASFSMAKGELNMISDPEHDMPGNRFNDGKCDVMGRFWAGTMSRDEEPGKGALYTLEKDFSVQKKVDKVGVSNGLAWSMDHKIMYYIDTLTFRIVAYDFDPETGNIRNPRVAVKIPQENGFPDGMTIDNEGKLWVAHWEGSRVCRWDPESGQKIGSIDMPVSKPTSCTFGGEKLDRLFVTSARVDLDEKQLAGEPLAGSLFVIDGLGVQGRRVNRFGVENL